MVTKRISISMPQTANTAMNVLDKLGWRVRPLNVTIEVEPPAILLDLKTVETWEKIPPGGFDLAQPSGTRNIDDWTHNRLLEESLSEYKDIWRTLAEK